MVASFQYTTLHYIESTKIPFLANKKLVAIRSNHTSSLPTNMFSFEVANLFGVSGKVASRGTSSMVRLSL